MQNLNLQLLLVGLLALIWVNHHKQLLVEGQQNGEVMVPGYKSQHQIGGGLQLDKLLDAHLQPDDRAVKTLQYLNSNGQPVLVQFTYVGPPKILPIATADSYPEGSTINLICTVSGGQRKGLSLGWLKDGNELSDDLLRYSNDALDNLSIEKTGVDISILRISNATYANSGRFTCTAKNPLGEDSTSVNIVINVELKWAKIPKDVEVGLNQDIAVECDAIGSPKPTIEWRKHNSNNDKTSNSTVLMSRGNFLKITRAQHKDSGLYECTAKNNVDEDLRRVIVVKVRGK